MFGKKEEEKSHKWELITKTYSKKMETVDENSHTTNNYNAPYTEQNTHKTITTFSKTTLLFLCRNCGEFKKIELMGEEVSGDNMRSMITGFKIKRKRK